MRKKCPREGTRLKFDAGAASAALYSPPVPRVGEVGTVVSVPLPGAGRKTCTGSHAQDLVYVDWPSVGVMGAARADVSKVKGKGPRQMQVNSSLGDLSIGQRVHTPHGPGEVRSKGRDHVGVQLDTGAYASVSRGEVQPTGERQRFINGVTRTRDQLTHEQKYKMALNHPEVVKLMAEGRTLEAQLRAHQIAMRINRVEYG